jgi:hypothetical protein
METPLMMIKGKDTWIDHKTNKMYVLINNHWKDLSYYIALWNDRNYYASEIFKHGEIDYSFTGDVRIKPFGFDDCITEDDEYFYCLVDCLNEIDILINVEQEILYGNF